MAPLLQLDNGQKGHMVPFREQVLLLLKPL
jgi:hypothetical protein